MDATHAIVRTALASVRADANLRAELTSQEPLGSVLEIRERRDEWVHCRGEDGYEGWVGVGGLLLRSAERAQAWWDDLGGVLAVAHDATVVDDSGAPVARLPWGARVALLGSVVRLPDGRDGRLGAGRLIPWEEAASGFPREAPAVMETASGWMGVPYLWGGRTRWGADCSGFVQAVYRTHGLVLPRDSYQQIEVGESVNAGPDFEAVRPSDLLFFHARDSRRVVHVAFSLGGPAILHAAEANGDVREDSLNGDSELERSLAGRVAGVRRLCE